MPKKDLFHKLSYTEQLEEILEKKPFSADCKNLLLSMLYKLDTSYNDYETVKRMVDPKKQVIEDILNIIKDCNDIKLIKPTSARMEQFKKKNINFKVDQHKKSIETEQNENSMLNAIYSLPIEKKVYLDEEHSAIRNSLPYILEKGKSINRAEIIRDFDAWSWNTTFSEIPSIECNLIYQNLQILLGKDFLENWMKLENTKNSLVMLNNKLKEMLEQKEAEEFLKLIFKISIIICCENDTKEKKRLKEELAWSTKELKRLSNTVKLVKDNTEIKTKAIKQIEKIDKTLNDKKLFEKELKRLNGKEEELRILTPDDLEIRLKRQRGRLENQIKEANNMLYVKQYMVIKSKIIKENDLLKAVEETDKKKEYILKLQKYFIKGMKSKIHLEENKKPIIDLMYLVRYYKFLPYFNEIYIKDIEELKNIIDKTEDMLIEKLLKLKIINRFSDNEDFDKKIIKNIFNIRMINLENINIEFINDKEFIFYDVETIEKKFVIENEGVKILKHNKKIKLFI